MPNREFSVATLLLDQSNPRFPPTTSQKDAIRCLLEDEPPKLLNLAQDIATTGELSPLELTCVVFEEGQAVVVEGNRRVAALKLLRKPSLAGVKDSVDAIKKIAEVGKGPSKIVAYVAESRDDARHWIELRHSGEMEGVAAKPWSSEAGNRFRRRANSQADKASRFSDAVLEEFPDDHALAADVAAVRKARLTTLGRLVADPAVAQSFGFGFTDDDVVFHFEHDEMVDGIRKMFADMKVGSVTQIKNKDHRHDYVIENATVLPRPARRLAYPRLPGAKTSTGTAGAPKGTGAASPKGGVKAIKPETVIFESLKLTHFSTRTQEVLKAAQKLKIDDITPVCAVMLRVVIEMVVTEIGVKKSWFGDAEQYRKKLRKCLLELDPKCNVAKLRDKALEAAWVGSQMDDAGSGMAIEQMHAYVHNFMNHPSAADVRAHSANFRPLLDRLNVYLATNP